MRRSRGYLELQVCDKCGVIMPNHLYCNSCGDVKDKSIKRTYVHEVNAMGCKGGKGKGKGKK